MKRIIDWILSFFETPQERALRKLRERINMIRSGKIDPLEEIKRWSK